MIFFESLGLFPGPKIRRTLIPALDIGLTPSSTVETHLDFDALYTEQVQLVARWVQRLGGPAIDVDDAVQEVFLIAYQHLEDFEGRSKVSTWLFRIVENVVRHQRRGQRMREWLGGNRVGETIHSSDPSASEALERKDSERRLYRALETLPERDRIPLILFELEEIPGEQIAEMLDINLGTVWTRLRRGRQKLLKRLESLELADARGTRVAP